MVSITPWIKEDDSSTRIVYRNHKNPNLKIEGYDFEEIYPELEMKTQKNNRIWLVGGVLNDKLIPNSPKKVRGKKEAIMFIAKLKDAYKRYGIDGLK